MRSDGWHLTEDLDEFPTQAMEFLRSRPARHTTLLTVVDKMRTPRAAAPGRPVRVLGWLEREGEVLAVSHWSTGMGVTALTPEQADEFAVYHVALGHALSIVTAEHDTATAFAEAWQRHTGTTPTVRVRLHLYRLGTLTGPERFPAGRGRALDERDHEDLMSWCRDFAAAVDEDVTSTLTPGRARASPRSATPSGRPQRARPSRWRAQPRCSRAWSEWTLSTPRPTFAAAATRLP
jgi:hypothetical protein